MAQLEIVLPYPELTGQEMRDTNLKTAASNAAASLGPHLIFLKVEECEANTLTVSQSGKGH